MKKLIITGATGLIGSALSASLSKKYHIIIITRNVEKAVRRFGNKYELISWQDKEKLIDEISGCYGIINLAGNNISSYIWTNSKKQKIINSRVNSGKILTEAIIKSAKKPEVFIQISGISYYTSDENAQYHEGNTCNNGSFLNHVAKLWESSTREVKNHGVRHVIARCGVVLSKESGALPKMLLPFRFFTGGPVASGKQWLSWIHLKDVQNAFEFILENENSSGIYNLTSPYPATNAELGKQIAKTLKRPYWFRVPGWGLKLILGQMAEETILASQHAIPKHLLDEGFKFEFSSLEEAIPDVLK